MPGVASGSRSLIWKSWPTRNFFSSSMLPPNAASDVDDLAGRDDATGTARPQRVRVRSFSILGTGRARDTPVGPIPPTGSERVTLGPSPASWAPRFAEDFVMPRSFWKGSLSFGLVEIPVRLHRATESHELGLAMLDRKDFSPIGYRRYNKNTGEEVPWGRIVRGYEYERDEYVTLTEDDLKRANVETTHSIEIVQFVQREEIEAIYYDAPYYVEPQKPGSKSYALLRDALGRMNRVGIAKIVLRVRQHVAALMVRDDVLVLDLLRYPHEIRSTNGLALPGRASTSSGRGAQEMRMAEQLIDGMTEAWKPARFKDEYHDDLMALVRRRVREGKTHEIHKAPPERERKTRQVVDLMDLLKQSLAKRGATRAPARAAAAKGTRRRSTRRRARSA